MTNIFSREINFDLAYTLIRYTNNHNMFQSFDYIYKNPRGISGLSSQLSLTEGNVGFSILTDQLGPTVVDENRRNL